MLDLFSGTGGASKAMCDRGWEVVSVEIDERFQADHRDVRTFTWTGRDPDLIWASPPCAEFSREWMPWCKTGRVPSMDLVHHALRIIRACGPRFWVLENVRGAVPYFFQEPMLRAPFVNCGPVFLWGDPPPMLWPDVRGWKERLSSKQKAARAAIPYEISSALARAVEASRRAA